MTSFHCCAVMRWKVVSRVMPALLTRMSTGPSLASTSRTIASASSGEETSPLTRGDVVTLRAHLLQPGLGLFLVAVIGGDLVAHVGQFLADGAADTAGAAGHQCDACCHVEGLRFPPESDGLQGF